ncbi:MAG: hypothetical protein JNK45_02360 [Myxococcales bacterium]|nr:hypothetical protein [Myxococcales bacterium]
MKSTDRLRTFESNYGREFGWFLEKDGEIVAALVEPRHEDQFWHSYKVEPVDAGSLPAIIFDPEFWHTGHLVFRNRETGEVVRGALAGGTIPTRERPRVTMRALYSHLRPTLIERVTLWLRRRQRAQENLK